MTLLLLLLLLPQLPGKAAVIALKYFLTGAKEPTWRLT